MLGSEFDTETLRDHNSSTPLVLLTPLLTGRVVHKLPGQNAVTLRFIIGDPSTILQ